MVKAINHTGGWFCFQESPNKTPDSQCNSFGSFFTAKRIDLWGNISAARSEQMRSVCGRRRAAWAGPRAGKRQKRGVPGSPGVRRSKYILALSQQARLNSQGYGATLGAASVATSPPPSACSLGSVMLGGSSGAPCPLRHLCLVGFRLEALGCFGMPFAL